MVKTSRRISRPTLLPLALAFIDCSAYVWFHFAVHLPRTFPGIHSPLIALVPSPTSIALCFDVTNSHLRTAFVTIFSILRVFQPSPYRISIYVFVGNLTLTDTVTGHLRCLEGLAMGVSIQVLNFDETILSDLKSVWHLSVSDPHMPFVVEYRLYFVEVVREHFVITLDTDLYAGRYFIPELFDIINADTNKSAFYAVHDQWAERRYQPRLNVTLSRYVNGGFWVVRNDRDGKAFMRLARTLLIANIHRAPIPDQDAVNLAAHLYPSKLYLLPGYFNCFWEWCWDRKLEGQAIHHRKGAGNFNRMRQAFSDRCDSK
jgi:lipopolysaccharide biosynthesis glycosyltransferase